MKEGQEKCSKDVSVECDFDSRIGLGHLRQGLSFSLSLSLSLCLSLFPFPLPPPPLSIPLSSTLLLPLSPSTKVRGKADDSGSA